MSKLTAKQRLFILYPVLSFVMLLVFMHVAERAFHDHVKRDIAYAKGDLQKAGMSAEQTEAVTAALHGMANDLSSQINEIGLLAMMLTGTLIPITSAIVNLQVQRNSAENKL